MKVDRSQMLASLPPEWSADLLPTIQAQVQASGVKIVVLDDDPTGTQTVYDVPVLTEWSQDSLAVVLGEPQALVYLLTNTRSLSLAQAQDRNREIAANLRAAGRMVGREFVLVSRSDSTLRGHYPGEVDALAETLGHPYDATLIVPFFLEGGRLTIDDIHYVAEGDWLIPAAQTEYAQDASFGYRHSNLRQWVAEKHAGRLTPEDVASVSLSTLRRQGPDAVRTGLARLSAGQVCVVNAVTYADMQVFVAGLLQAEAEGKRFIYRTAASFVRVRGGLAARPLLTSQDLGLGRGGGGLIVAGSYVQKSTLQIEATRALAGVVPIEVKVDRLLDAGQRQEAIRSTGRLAGAALRDGLDVLVSTSRRLVTGSDGESSLRIGQSISAALVELVRNIPVAPSWIIAKGGITSSDIATRALDIRRAQVLGQAIPGVPIWRTGADSRWPGLPYVVFPGNVGGPDAMARMVQILRGQGQGEIGNR